MFPTNQKSPVESSSSATKAASPSNKSNPLMQLFTDGLKDMLWSEEAIVDGLKKLQKAADNTMLLEAFEEHEIETKKHISRLEKAFESIGMAPQKKKCAAMEGILKEADEIIKSTPENSATRDAGLIIAAQKVEHYEIASYGGLVALAHTLQLTKVANRLQQTLDEEEYADLNLTEIAETEINFDASEEGREQQGETQHSTPTEI